MNVANVKPSSTVDACSSAHQLFQENVFFQSDVEHSVNWEDLKILVELPSGSWESVENYTLGGFWLLDLLIDNLDNNLVTDQSTRLDNAADGLDESFIKAAGDSSLEDFSDFVTS